MSGVVKVPGVAVNMSGERLVVPPLSLGALEQLQQRLQAFTGDVSSLEQVATAIDTLHAALRRNYPDMTRERVAELLDIGNLIEAMEAAMDVAGLKRKAAEAAQAAEGGAPGE